MFERFTDRARRVVVLAQEEARLLNHNYIGTEHILLGLLREADGVAARVLERLGVSSENVREKVTAIIGEGAVVAPSGHIPFTPRSKKVLELSLREALQLGHNYIGTEHILLGLLREGQGVAAQVLVTLGLELSWVRQAVIAELSRIAPPGQMRGAGPSRVPETPAAAQASVQARRLAAGSAVGSQHYLLALMAQEDSLAARALGDLGVTKEAVEARLAELEPTGTSDETPEQAGARRISLRVEGELIVLELDDPKLASALEEAIAGRKARIIRGTDPEAAGFPGLWSAVSRTVEEMTRRLRFRGVTIPTETERTGTALGFRDPADAPDLTQIAPYRPPEWDASVDAGSFAVVNQTDGTRSYLEVARDVDREALRAWLHAWIESNRTTLAAASRGEPSTLWFVVRPAGDSFQMGQFGFGPGGPRDAAPTSCEALVDSALRTLSAQV